MMMGFTTTPSFGLKKSSLVSGFWIHLGFGNGVSHVFPVGPLWAGMEGQLWGGFKLCHERKIENA